jgi:hypothetical protein
MVTEPEKFAIICQIIIIIIGIILINHIMSTTRQYDIVFGTILMMLFNTSSIIRLSLS